MAEKRLEGKIALVTGSTSGIGKAICERFAENGAKVIVTGRRVDLGKSILASIREAGGEAEFFPADVAEDKDCEELVNFTVKSFGGIDILVNNAGLVPRNPDGSMADGLIHRTNEEYWERIWRVDLRSIFKLTKLAMPFLLNSKYASVIHISSVHGVTGCGMDIYSAIKGAVISLTKSMAVSYAHRVRVNCISPAMVIVERTQKFWDTMPEVQNQVYEAYLTRVGVPDDVAYCALYLASNEAEYVTGANITLDGGVSVHGVLPPGPIESRSRLQVQPGESI